MVTIANPTTTPTVYSSEGHSLGAGERREGVSLDAIGQAAVTEGRLVILIDDTDGPGEEDAATGAPPARRTR